MSTRQQGLFRKIADVGEISILLAGLTFLATSDGRALAAWLASATLYLIVGFAVVWKGRPVDPDVFATAPTVVRWSWIPPVLAAAVGAVSAVMALQAWDAGPSDQMRVVAASLGVILSWVLLQVGFAEVYLILDVTGGGEDLRFPEPEPPSTLDYLYFAFTLGASFATSDVQIITVRVRRLVLIHTVLAFFYNALVVAVAFQVLHRTVSQ